MDMTRVLQDSGTAPGLSLMQPRHQLAFKLSDTRRYVKRMERWPADRTQLCASGLQWNIRCEVLQTARFWRIGQRINSPCRADV